MQSRKTAHVGGIASPGRFAVVCTLKTQQRELKAAAHHSPSGVAELPGIRRGRCVQPGRLEGVRSGTPVPMERKARRFMTGWGHGSPTKPRSHMKYNLIAALSFSIFAVLFFASSHDLLTTASVAALCAGYIALWRGERAGAFNGA